MIQFVIPGAPVPKLRPRFTRHGKTYDTQSKQKEALRLHLLSQLRDNGILSVSKAPLSVQMVFHTPIPKNTPRKAAKALEGHPNVKRPDLDNYAKFPLDVMNGLVYEDDNQIFDLWCEKRYSSSPRVEIFIKERTDDMINEHAMTINTLEGDITASDLNYMVKKANRLGLRDRELVRVFMEEDDEGKHIYFECEGPKQKRHD